MRPTSTMSIVKAVCALLGMTHFAQKLAVVAQNVNGQSYIATSECMGGDGDQFVFFAENTESSFYVANETCNMIEGGAQIVLVRNIDEYNFVFDFWRTYRPDHHVHVGLQANNTVQDRFGTLRFKPLVEAWYNYSFFETWGQFPWEGGQPNDQSNQQKCVEWFPPEDNYTRGYWDDKPCGQHAGIICRKPCPPPAPSVSPTSSPVTSAPTTFPTVSPSTTPTFSPIRNPTSSPLPFPTESPTMFPTRAPLDPASASPDNFVFSPSIKAVVVVGVVLISAAMALLLYARRQVSNESKLKNQGVVPTPDLDDFEFSVDESEEQQKTPPRPIPSPYVSKKKTLADFW